MRDQLEESEIAYSYDRLPVAMIAAATSASMCYVIASLHFYMHWAVPATHTP